MEITKASAELITPSGPDRATSNVIPFPSSQAQTQAQAAATYSAPSEDRFTPSSPDLASPDGVADSVTLSPEALSTASAREARAAAVITAVQNGTYQIDSKAAATAIIARMLGGAETSGSE